MKKTFLFIPLSAIILFVNLFLFASDSFSKLEPGFDPAEYRDILAMTARQIDTPWTKVPFPLPPSFRLEYRSQEAGLANRWDLWIRDDSVAIINVRGTIARADSWSENFFSAMVPAEGSIAIDSNFVFIYKLAEDKRASVHAGWLTGLAYLSESIVTKINQCYGRGIRQFIITGHSQGGAISYLLTSYLHYQLGKRIPADITFKTYSSAPPKPGNIFFANDYDYITRGGWAFRIYNTEDWVPQTPLSVQTTSDFAEINPYSERDSITIKMVFFEKLIFDYMTGRLAKSLNDTRDLISDYFGNIIFKHSISSFLKTMPMPLCRNDAYYYPCGIPIVLMKQEGYEEAISEQENVPLLFKNHLILPYYYLLNKIYFGK